MRSSSHFEGSEYLHFQGKAVTLLLALLHPEDEGSMILWNICSYTPNDTVSHSRVTECFTVLLWEHPVSLFESTSLFLQVFYVQAVHQKVRRQCVQFIKRNEHKFEEVIDLQFCCCMRLLAFVWNKSIMSSEGEQDCELRYWFWKEGEVACINTCCWEK